MSIVCPLFSVLPWLQFVRRTYLVPWPPADDNTVGKPRSQCGITPPVPGSRSFDRQVILFGRHRAPEPAVDNFLFTGGFGCAPTRIHKYTALSLMLINLPVCATRMEESQK